MTVASALAARAGTRNSSKPFLGHKLPTQKMSDRLTERPVFGASGQLFGKRHDVMKVQHCLTARRPHPIAAIMGLDATRSRYALLQNSGSGVCNAKSRSGIALSLSLSLSLLSILSHFFPCCQYCLV